MSVRPTDVSVRPVDAGRPEDIATVLDLGRRHQARWSGSPAGWLDHTYVPSLLGTPGFVADRDLLLVEEAGSGAAVVALFGRPPYSEVVVQVFTDPDLPPGRFPAVGRAAVAAAERSIRTMLHEVATDSDQDGADTTTVVLALPGEPLVGILLADGFEHLRSTLVMRRTLDRPLVVPPLPDGVTVRAIDPQVDCDDLVTVMEAFADHGGDWVLDADWVRSQLALPAAHPELGLLASDPDGPVAALLVLVEPDGAMVESVATVRRRRRQGLATALLGRAFEAIRSGGTFEVRLRVQTDSATGAVGLYEGVGMVRESELLSLGRPLTPQRLRSSPPEGP